MFLVDSGATHRITPFRSLLDKIVQLADPVQFGLAVSGSTIGTAEKDEIATYLPSGQGIVFRDVHYEPNVRQSILSAGLFRQRSWRGISRKKNC